MINPNHSISSVNPLQRLTSAPAAAPVPDESEAMLEEFLSSWTQGVPGSDRMSLDQMISLQAASNPEMPPAATVAPRQTDAEERAISEIEFLVRQNRSLFQSQGPGSMTDGWNIAGQR